MRKKARWQYFCILPSDWPEWIYSSIQVQLYDLKWSSTYMITTLQQIYNNHQQKALDRAACNLYPNREIFKGNLPVLKSCVPSDFPEIVRTTLIVFHKQWNSDNYPWRYLIYCYYKRPLAAINHIAKIFFFMSPLPIISLKTPQIRCIGNYLFSCNLAVK